MKDAFDSHYTPTEIAEKLVQLVKLKKVTRVADFAAGFGSLLEAANYRFPKAKFFANDISLECHNHINESFPKWIKSSFDFFNPSDIENFKSNINYSDFNLILLNPPFSQRGGLVKQGKLNNTTVNCSPAMAFVLNSLNFLKKNGELIALLPLSCSTSQKDDKARKLIESHFKLTVEMIPPKKIFYGCNVNTICVRISSLKHFEIKKGNNSIIKNLYVSQSTVGIFRGKLPNHKAIQYISDKGFNLIHTTNIKKGIVLESNQIVLKDSSTILGPCVLIPRVCTPTFDKIAVFNSNKHIVITDCLIAIYPHLGMTLDDLYILISSNWNSLKSYYSGTCAQYLTIDKLEQFFYSLNVNTITKKFESICFEDILSIDV